MVDVGIEVVLPSARPVAVVVAAFPRLNPVLEEPALPPKLKPLDVVVVVLFRLKEDVVVAGCVLAMLKPDVVVVGVPPKLKPVPVVVTEVVVEVEAPIPNPISIDIAN